MDKEEKRMMMLEDNFTIQKEGKIVDSLLEESIEIPASYGKPKRPQSRTKNTEPPVSKAYEIYKAQMRQDI